MQTFLDKAAEYVFKKHTLAELSRVGVVLPTRRAVYYFKKALSQFSDKPFLAPDVWAIDDFVMYATGVRQIDQITLLFELFEVFKETDPNIDFDRFMTWASTVLSDFDRIDLYLVDTKALFSWMTDARAIERWNIDRPTYTKTTALTDKYFKLFRNLNNVYESLQNRLTEKRMVYRGMAYRLLAENLFEYLLAKPTHEQNPHYYFVGFNALSIAEERIFSQLARANKADFLWDTDDFYMESRDQEAGQWLRMYKHNKDEKGNDFTYFFGGQRDWKWQSNQLITSPKNIQVIGVANASMQAKIAGAIYEKWIKEDSGTPLGGTPPGGTPLGRTPLESNHTAIVLGDETLLIPVMNSLGDDINDLNITMGLSLRQSLLFTLIDALFEMQRNLVTFRTKDGEKVKIPKFSHKHVLRVLNHPYVRRYELSLDKGSAKESDDNVFRSTIHTIYSQNRVFLDTDELLEMGKNDRLFQILFGRWNDDPRRAMKAFHDLILVFQELYKKETEAIDTEYFYQFFLILQRMDDLLEERGRAIKMRSFKTFLYELVKQTKIPFSGEPVSPLQIMGMLETRTLDFERIILLSVNEGVLPAGKQNNTLIPFDAALEFGIPTHSQQDAVMAYHFYRLLQRAKEVVLMHVLPSDTYGAGERSRFLLQIEHELSRINPNLRLSYPEVVFGEKNTVETSGELMIQKTPEILAIIENEITERGIYPSNLNQYLRCSLQYYFNKIAGISQEEEIEDELAADSFGNWIHKVFENIDNYFLENKRFIDKEDLQQVLTQLPERLEEAFRETNRGLQKETGLNYIVYQVGEKIVKDFINYQIENETFPIELLDTERTIKVDFETFVKDRPIRVKMAGRIDRLDRVTGHEVRVIDYKTGMVNATELKKGKETIEEALANDDKDKFRQLWLYKYMILKRMYSDKGLTIKGTRLKPEENIVTAGIYSFRNIGAGLLAGEITFSEADDVSTFLEASEARITDFVNDLLDPAKPFQKTDDVVKCQQGCSYRRICGR
jgi:hypothetical protein